MDLATLKTEARKKMNGYCRVCPACNGRACAGEVPGMGGTGSGASFMANFDALAAVKLNLSAIHDVLDPDTASSFFGQAIRSPIMAAPMVNSKLNAGGALSEKEMAEAITVGTHLAGSLTWLGAPLSNSYEWYDAMEGVGRGVVIGKPLTDQDRIIETFRSAEKRGAVAVGIDVDGAGLVTMKLLGYPVGPKTISQLQELAQSTRLPFVVKGVMTAADAVKCAEAGVSAIVVSNHGGRVLDHTCGTAEALPAIANEVKGRMTVLVDGGVRSGTDVLKMLALGADGVLVGRPLIVGAYGGGAEGVKLLLEKYMAELYAAMILTGCASIKDIDSRILASRFCC